MHPLKVILGNFNDNIGRIRFTGTSISNNEEDELTIIIIIVVISIIIASIVMLIIVGAVFKRVREYCHRSSSKSVNDEVVNMYASPAYGTHQVFTEPGLDHLYEIIDDKRCEESTLQVPNPLIEDKEIGLDGLEIKRSCEVDDGKAVTAETNADNYLEMRSSRDNQTVAEGIVDNAGTHQAVSTGKPKLTLHNDERNMSEVGCNQREDNNSPQHSDYENEDEDTSAAAPSV